MTNAVNQLDKNRFYNYINPQNKGLIKIVHINLPEGPIIIKRYDPSKGGSLDQAKEESISSNLIWRVANAIKEGVPINIDRVLGASYNTRSVLESLLAYTSNFYVTYPGRIEMIDSYSKIKKGHKHIVWLPETPHELGKICEIDTEQVISEIPSHQAVYESLVVPYNNQDKNELDIEIKRRHAQIQVALIHIGIQLGFRTWIAQNDKGIIYKDKKIGEINGVVQSLENEKLLMGYSDAAKAALLIDCIWFKNSRLMPAIMEIECTTGIRSGLTRMKTFSDLFPPFPTRYVIVAPDEDKPKFMQEASKKQFRDLYPKFFPFSAVEELYALCQRRNIKGITEEFLDSFIEDPSFNS
ncbi:restriction endonuclease [Flexistipes sp.]|uniref:restriction endonuclease n=1 Tax=Flexistipes sp. TaxID=3088135 RepID=UPI003FA56D60